ncbi:hypothetical protein BgAZ_108050 [Babesia gibsoni]|uniref:Transmembrane protein n=1 Tax=Babesia gibsoni TaxID=33632 RepID=A0AAD8UWE5_BABGI|nr:hypothetical protein BgAZ_108050 [Babesia gibsoni]
MAAFARKITFKNDRFSKQVAGSNGAARKPGTRRSTSFYVLCFLLVVLVVSGVFEMLVMPRRVSWHSAQRAFSSERARQAGRLWDTLVPERNWSPLTPQFWVLLVATVSLYSYNRRGSNQDSGVIDAEEQKRKDALSRMENKRGL